MLKQKIEDSVSPEEKSNLKRVLKIQEILSDFVAKGKFDYLPDLKEDELVAFEEVCKRVYNILFVASESSSPMYAPSIVVDSAIEINKLLPPGKVNKNTFFKAFLTWSKSFFEKDIPTFPVELINEIKDSQEELGRNIRGEIFEILNRYSEDLKKFLEKSNQGVANLSDILNLDCSMLQRYFRENHREWYDNWVSNKGSKLKGADIEKILEKVNDSSWLKVSEEFGVSPVTFRQFVRRHASEKLKKEYKHLMLKEKNKYISKEEIKAMLGEEFLEEAKKLAEKIKFSRQKVHFIDAFLSKHWEKFKKACSLGGLEDINNILGFWKNSRSLWDYLKEKGE